MLWEQGEIVFTAVSPFAYYGKPLPTFLLNPLTVFVFLCASLSFWVGWFLLLGGCCLESIQMLQPVAECGRLCTCSPGSAGQQEWPSLRSQRSLLINPQIPWKVFWKRAPCSHTLEREAVNG